MSAPRAWSGRVVRFEVTDSTNERALAAIAEHSAHHGDVFVAREQTRGRGRRGATWHSPAGEGLYFSVSLLPSQLASSPALTMASGVAVRRALVALGLSGAALHWPNDVFVGAAKLAGILVETRGLDAAAPHYVVGIGINVAQRAFAPELTAERAVTSLTLEGVASTPERVLERVVSELEPALELALADPEATAREYCAAAALAGARVRVESPHATLVGRVAEFGLAHGLTLADDSGVTHAVPLAHVRALARAGCGRVMRAARATSEVEPRAVGRPLEPLLPKVRSDSALRRRFMLIGLPRFRTLRGSASSTSTSKPIGGRRSTGFQSHRSPQGRTVAREPASSRCGPYTARPPMARNDGRALADLRSVTFQRHFTDTAPGSVLACFGRTRVLCTAMYTDGVPPFLQGRGQGWLTAEYAMLPSASPDRKQRDRTGKVDGRSIEIQRLIGRSLRAVVELKKLTERTIWIDCDVIQADGGTRCAAITGAWIALHDLLTFMDGRRILRAWPLTTQVAAVSVGRVGGQILCDLDYSEDSKAETDANIVMTGAGQFVEVQGSAEGAPFSREDLDAMLETGGAAITRLFELQKAALAAK